MVIVIALVIGVICAALVAVASFYRLQHQKSFRFERLQHNLHSGMERLLANTDSTLSEGKSIDLYNDEQDSLLIQKYPWGMYDVGIVKAYKLQDTICSIFTIARTVDSAKWCALYLADEDRPLGVTGKTLIEGDAWLPAADVKSTYVDGKQYEGPKNIISGKTSRSKAILPELDKQKIQQIRDQFGRLNTPYNGTEINGIMTVPYDQNEKRINISKRLLTLTKGNIGGHVVICSDSTVIIDSTMQLHNVLIFAKTIEVKNGFKGSCQLFATDSIAIGKRCRFDYPSAAGIVRPDLYKVQVPVQIRLGNGTVFNGSLFTYEKQPDVLKPVIELGDGAQVSGQIYTPGYVRLSEKGNKIYGSVFCNRFLYRTAFSTFENYLINATISSKKLSPYYLTGNLLPVSDTKQQVLQWLERR